MSELEILIDRLDAWLEWPMLRRYRWAYLASKPCSCRLEGRSEAKQHRMLAWLAINSEPDVRWALARNDTMPAGILRILAKDPDALVRQQLASNKNLPDDLIPGLIEDRETRRLVDRHNLAPNLKRRLAELDQADPDAAYHVND